MKISEYAALDAVALASLVRRGELPAIEVTEAAIGAIEALDADINALVLTDFAGARAGARRVRLDQPLAGVPFAIKDVGVYVDGWPTTMSSRFYAGARPRPDSEIVKRWRAAGTVFVGKTNTPEFAGEFVTEPTFRGITRNPWDARRTVGGSSGGAAAAVASGMVPVASGSDVGGSIRVPAACCGLFGLKPSRGLNPQGPYFADGGAGLNCEHVLSRSVRDSAAFLDATAGPEPGAPYRVVRPVRSYLDALSDPVGKLRIAYTSQNAGGAPIDAEIADKLGAAAALLEGLGHEVMPRGLPAAALGAITDEGWTNLWMMDTALAIQDRAAELGRPPAERELERLSWYIKQRIDRLGALDYVACKRFAHRVNLAMAEAFADVDLIMTPTTATLPPAVASIGADVADFSYERWSARSYAFGPFSGLFNVTGQPAASLPLFESAQGLPIGIQLAGKQDADHVVLRVAAQLELATEWTRRHPPRWAGSLP